MSCTLSNTYKERYVRVGLARREGSHQTKLIPTSHLSIEEHKEGLLKQVQAKNNWVWTLGMERNEVPSKQPEADEQSGCWCCCYLFNELINTCGRHSHKGVMRFPCCLNRHDTQMSYLILDCNQLVGITCNAKLEFPEDIFKIELFFIFSLT